MANVVLSEIHTYPVKSFAGVRHRSVLIDRFGPDGDRRWMLVDDAGKFLSQRRYAEMALFRVEHAQGNLLLRYANDQISVPVPAADAVQLEVQVWQDQVKGIDAGDDVSSWLTTRLEIPCRLVYMPDDCQRLVDRRYANAAETVGFADGFPLMLLSQASLDDLNSRLQTPVPMNRFRPNLVVSGCAAYAEDSWRQIRIGEMLFELVKPCSRCVIPSIDQQTALRDSSINRVLASYRRRQGKVYFGQNLLYASLGSLNEGDTVDVLA